jgi:transcriptional regulator GlxA family with amidase domain
MLDDCNSEAPIAPAPGEPCSIAMPVLPDFNTMAAQAFIDLCRAADPLTEQERIVCCQRLAITVHAPKTGEERI